MAIVIVGKVLQGNFASPPALKVNTGKIVKKNANVKITLTVEGKRC